MSDNFQDELIDYEEPQHFQEEFEYAGFFLRFGALFIDGLIIQVPFRLLSFAFIEDVESQLGLSVLSIVAHWLYYALMESSEYQATVSKRMVGIYVTDLTGNRISFLRATGRYFAKILSSLTLLIGYIMAAFTKKRQALHDIVAGTLVVAG
jgi:uncharacterized RDD family membrane protein YckC